MQSTDPGLRVLVVEDDPALREVYAEVLAAEGFRVRVAADGQEALDVLSDGSPVPCALLLDLRMPGMNGWQLAARIHQDDALRTVPIVVVAAHYLVADEARRIGAARWLQKPVNLDRLVMTMREICTPAAGMTPA